MDCWGVKGYTASTASALQLRMMAISVVNTSVLIRRLLMRMPLAARASLGTSSRCRRRWLSMRGMFLSAAMMRPSFIFSFFINSIRQM